MSTLELAARKAYAYLHRFLFDYQEGSTVTDTPQYDQAATTTGDATAAGTTDTPQPDAAPQPDAQPGTLDGDEVIAEARKRLEAGEGLDALHVRAIEHPEEFAGQQVAAPDTGIAPTS